MSVTKSNFVRVLFSVKTRLSERSSDYATTAFETCRRVAGGFFPVSGLAQGARKCRKNSAQNYRHGKSGKERRPLEMPGPFHIQTIITVVTVGLKRRKKSISILTLTTSAYIRICTYIHTYTCIHIYIYTHILSHNTFG